MRLLILLLALSILLSSNTYANSGLISIKSAHSVKTTAGRLINTLKLKGMTLFARINHGAAAHKVGKPLRPTELVIFGNPNVGTLLMQCSQSVAIDLPQKALIWEDESGQVWYSYNSPKYLAERHKINGCEEVINKVTHALENLAKAATKR